MEKRGPQTPTKILIIIEDSLKEQDEVVPLEKKKEEETSKQASPRSPRYKVETQYG